MSPISPARRRAEEFASLLDGRGAPGQHSDALQLVGALRALTVPQPSAAYSAELRSNLLAAADTLLVPTATAAVVPQFVRPQRHQRKIAVAAGTLAILGGTTGVAMAAQSALPGETLYPIKRILESAQTSLSADEAARADRIMDLAAGRLDETRALADKGSTGSQAEIPDSLDDFVTQAAQAAEALLGQYADSGDIDTIIQLRNFVADSLHALAGIKGSVPAEYAGSFDDAVNALLGIDERALSMCGSCGSLLDIPAILLSGAPIQPSAPTAAPAPTRVAPTAAPTNAVTDLLKKLPTLGAATPPATTPTAPVLPTLPPADATNPIQDLLGETTTTTAPTGALEGLLNGLLDPLLGENGLL